MSRQTLSQINKSTNRRIERIERISHRTPHPAPITPYLRSYNSMKEQSDIITTTDYQVMDLSPELFWDCRQEELDWEQHERLIVQRVLQRGLMRDWTILRSLYGVMKIAEIAMHIRTLDSVTLTFISTISGTDSNRYSCSAQRLSIQTPWNS